MKPMSNSFAPRIRITLSIFALLCLGLALFSPGSAGAQGQSYVLQGRVLSYESGPVAGATITLYSQPEHVAVRQTTSDAEGNFVIETGPGTFAMDAVAPGFLTEEQTVYVTSYESGILFLLREEAPQQQVALVATLTGRVLSADNVPLGGMNIVAYNRQQGDSSNPRPVLSAAISDANGNYSLRVPAGTVWPSLLTQAVWGYDYTPFNVAAGQTITDVIFVAQVRVLPRVQFPTPTVEAPPTPMPTATPASGVSPIVGMPRTGGESLDMRWLLLALPALVMLGFALRLRGARGKKRRVTF